MAYSRDQRREPSFSELVKRTEGPQPWRRVFHVVNGVLIVLALRTFSIGTWTAVAFLGSVLSVLLLLDGVRLANARWNRLFFKVFAPLASPREVGKPASSTWYLLGVVLTLLVFPRPLALAGILVLALADPVASWLGKKWGRRRFGSGTIEGSTVFFFAALLILAFFVPFWAALAAAAITALVESLPWGVDDNLTIPPAVAGILWILALF